MITVMGATGNTGGEISRRLLDAGEQVRVLGRSAERLGALAARGAEPVAGDATDAEHLARAFAGADAVYVLMPYDPAGPDYRAQQRRLGSAVTDALARAEVGRVVALSSIGADVADGTGAIASLHEQEQRLRALEGVDLLLLRPGMFFETFYGSLEFVAAAGFLGDVVGPRAEIPMVASRDVAAVAAEALRQAGPAGTVVQELLGPRDLTYPEVAAILGERIGRPGLEYRRMAPQEMTDVLVGAGLSPDVARHLVVMGEALDDGTVRATGPRDPALTPTTFEAFAGELARAFQPA